MAKRSRASATSRLWLWGRDLVVKLADRASVIARAERDCRLAGQGHWNEKMKGRGMDCPLGGPAGCKVVVMISCTLTRMSAGT